MKPRYIVEAEALLGQTEVSGKLANPVIVDLFKDAGHPEVISDEVPWCAAFVGACLVRANQPPTGTLLARDYLSEKYKVLVDDFGKKPVLYSIGVMQRGNSSWEGHVGFVVDFDKNWVWLLGGNQSNSVSVAKFPRKKFLGFVMPKAEVQDVPVEAVIADSRRLTTQTWGERTLAGLGLGGAISWQTLEQVKVFLQDHWGQVLLGTIAAVWLGSRLLKWMSIREYREGRYLPKKQWSK